MALRIIRINGDPVLRQTAKDVKKIKPPLLALFDDMVETMIDAEGVGLAAPQIGISKRIIVVDGQDKQGIRILINPVITEREGKETAVEGCLSIPRFAGEVERDEIITVRSVDKNGQENELRAQGLLARILQHEIDHLDGILFIDRAERIIEKSEDQE